MVYNMEWKLISPNRQKDTVGNILQVNGAVQAKACQKCKKLFKSKIIIEPQKQDAPYYKCENCDFEHTSPNNMLLHLQDKSDHRFKLKTKERIIGYKNKLIGSFANITKADNDVIILCDDCK